MKHFYVYILSNKKNGTLYTGVTSSLSKRIWEHKTEVVNGFSKQHGLHRLVYYEQYDDAENAIVREKRIKKWNRSWKIRLINKCNAEWRDLYEEVSKQ